MSNRLSVKNLKTCDTHDGGGFQVSLYFDGKRVGVCTKHGNGGPMQYDINKNLAEVEAYAKSICKEDTTYVDPLDSIVYYLVNQLKMENKLKKFCKKGIIFTKKKEEGYFFEKAPYSSITIRNLKDQIPDIDEIVNERFEMAK